jgi:hypothetical protein
MSEEKELAGRINKSYMDAVEEAVQEYSRKKGDKKVSLEDFRKIVIKALTSYKQGIIQALKVHTILDEIEEARKLKK